MDPETVVNEVFEFVAKRAREEGLETGELFMILKGLVDKLREELRPVVELRKLGEELRRRGVDPSSLASSLWPRP